MSQLKQVLSRLRHWVGSPDADDRALLERFAEQHDEAAFIRILQRHADMVHGVCRRMLRHEADVEDAFQAVFLVLVKQATAIPWRESIAGWLYQVAYRTAAKLRVRAARRQHHESQVPPVMNSTTEPLDEALRPQLDDELARLPDKLRQPLVLCYLEGRSRAEAAGQLGCSAAALKSRLERGRDLLRDRLQRRGLTLSAGALAAWLTAQARAGAAPIASREAAARAALEVAAGRLTAPPLSTDVMQLITGECQMLQRARMRRMMTWMLLFGLSAAGAGWLTFGSSNAAPLPDEPGKQQPAKALRVEARFVQGVDEEPAKIPEDWVIAEVKAIPVNARIGERVPKHVAALTDWLPLPIDGITDMKVEGLTVRAQVMGKEPLAINLGLTAGNANAMLGLEVAGKPGAKTAKMLTSQKIYMVVRVVAIE